MKIVLVGANGMLASAFRNTVPANVSLVCFNHSELDITDQDEIDVRLSTVRPDIIINCAAYTQVDSCESNCDIAFQVNAKGPERLAIGAKKIEAVLVHISTDFVFSGDSTIPYGEDDTTLPCSVYGQSKLCGEEAILSSGLDEYYIVRTSWLYGPNGNNFVETIIRLANERDEISIVDDQVGTPTYTLDLVAAIWTLIGVASTPAPYGTYHYSNNGQCTWYDFACEIVNQVLQTQGSVNVARIKPISTSGYPLPAKRPPYSVLSKLKIKTATGLTLPSWQESLHCYIVSRIKE